MSIKTLVLAGILVIGGAFLIGYVLRGDTDTTASPTPSSQATASPTAKPSTPTPSPKPVTHTIRFSATGMVPSTATIRAGDSVMFVNDLTANVWPASDPHPTHDRCPGFDAKRPLQSGDTYTLTFAQPRTCSYHDHLDPSNPAHRGTIVIQ